MTKQEYLQKLQEKLERFSQELQEEILEDYRQHFAEGRTKGSRNMRSSRNWATSRR